jgi:hypothetical protein
MPYKTKFSSYAIRAEQLLRYINSWRITVWQQIVSTNQNINFPWAGFKMDDNTFTGKTAAVTRLKNKRRNKK